MKIAITGVEYQKLMLAFNHLDRLVEANRKFKQERDLPNNLSPHITDAHRYLREVLYDTQDEES